MANCRVPASMKLGPSEVYFTACLGDGIFPTQSRVSICETLTTRKTFRSMAIERIAYQPAEVGAEPVSSAHLPLFGGRIGLRS